MPEPRPPLDDTPAIDPSRKEAPVSDPTGTDAPSRKAPPAETPGAPAEPEPSPTLESGKPTPHERVQKLRLGVRVVWWSAVVLTIAFAGLALWMGVGQRDPFFALFYLALAACCAVAGYGTLLAVRRPSAS